MACTNCKRRKRKCTGELSGCAYCLMHGFNCMYPPARPPSQRRKSAAKKSSSNALLTQNSAYLITSAPAFPGFPPPTLEKPITHKRKPSGPLKDDFLRELQRESGYEPPEDSTEAEDLPSVPWVPEESATESPSQPHHSFYPGAYGERQSGYLDSSGPVVDADMDHLYRNPFKRPPDYVNKVNDSCEELKEPADVEPPHVADPLGEEVRAAIKDIASCAGFVYSIEIYASREETDVGRIVKATEYSLGQIRQYLEMAERIRGLCFLMLNYTALADTVTFFERAVALMPLFSSDTNKVSAHGKSALREENQTDTKELADNLREQLKQCVQLVDILRTRLNHPTDPDDPHRQLTSTLHIRLHLLMRRCRM
ncbi:hypothetical protein AbraIFM66951_000510 [Aspergillus brasiliensis]|nr:hypothetical protein AbraIFM66951_000510 [Aspergillus brasiliensis]